MYKAKILIADDDRDHLLMLAVALNSGGYQVLSAVDATTAIQMAAEQAPDLLLLDIHLGTEDGFSIQKRLRKIGALNGAPVIYLSGDKSNQAQRLAESLGAFALIGKPFDRAALLAEIGNALRENQKLAAPCGEPIA